MAVSANAAAAGVPNPLEMRSLARRLEFDFSTQGLSETVLQSVISVLAVTPSAYNACREVLLRW